MSGALDHLPSMPLAPAHQGYEYQDLLVAARLVDVMLGTVMRCVVDAKLVPDDIFDDLTTVDSDGRRERIQFKHTGTAPPPLPLTTFTNDKRGLRLARVIASVLADRDGPGAAATDSSFRIVLPDTPPTDTHLISVLEPARPDPGPFLPGMDSLRMRFRPAALRREPGCSSAPAKDTTNPFPFQQLREDALDRRDLDWICEHLLLELAAPPASLDLTAPGPAERLLLHRITTEVGAGLYPNADRSPVDVAEALIRCARAARQGSHTLTARELLRRTQLRTDFGAVARATPVDPSLEIPRSTTVTTLAHRVTAAAQQGQNVLFVGPPGQGKSWLCDQLLNHLSANTWLVAEHYCYLSDADGHRFSRVRAASVFGSLLRWLSEYNPDLVAEQRPRFAADAHALETAVLKALRKAPDRPVALVVDGLDHVTRVAPAAPAEDPSLMLSEALAALRLPRGSTLIVLSQPGGHLAPLTAAGAVTLPIPPLTDTELRTLAVQHGLVTGPTESAYSAPRQPLLTTAEATRDFLATLSHRSAGNALYATYLCREALRNTATMADPSATLRRLPQFDGSLLSYYHHIHLSLGEGAWVGDVLALLDFPVTRIDLKEIRTDSAHRVAAAFEVLRPVLSESATQGGARIYHESFARFLRLAFRDDADAIAALRDHIICWLQRKGLFEDWRAFHHLLPTLSEANHNQRVLDTVGRDFVVNAIAAAFPAQAILKNLAVAVGCAARIEDWPAVARYIEMSRSAETYQGERFESAIVGFADVLGHLFGPDTLATRLLHDGRPIMDARSGLQMCAALDHLGAVVPWSEYMTAYSREAADANTAYEEASDRAVATAWLRGRLRLASLNGHTTTSSHPVTAPNSDADDDRHLYARINTETLAKHLDETGLPAADVVQGILDTLGLPTLLELLPKLARPGTIYLALAEAAAAGAVPDAVGRALPWASQAAACGVHPGHIFRLMALGVTVDDLAPEPVEYAQELLLELTGHVQAPSLGGDSDRVGTWLDACTVAARRDSPGLAAAERTLDGPGWYTCWLRFAIALVRAEVEAADRQSSAALRALRILTEVREPFLGEPRACDLYPIHGLIHTTIERAVALLDDRAWREGLDCLHRVCDAISTTIDGELGGPVRRDRLLHLAVETATPARRTAARDFITREIATGGAGRYYSDLAEYHLVAARLSVVANDVVEARSHWTDACRLLVAYGWHKDTTVYEVLDPLPTLIAIDPARGRASVARLQPLCERLPQHTDGRGTREVRSRWWRLLAAGDPCALARLVQVGLLSACNQPNWLLHGAISDLWRSWHHRAEPGVAAALRLTLQEALEGDDAAALARLADVAARVGSTAFSRLLVATLARVDERPVTYNSSDSDELLGRDRERVDALNVVAERSGAPRVGPLPTQPIRPDDPNANASTHARPAAVPHVADPAAMPFRPGVHGVAEAVRAWRGRPYDGTAPDWSVTRFANLLGYRLLELFASDGEGHAEASLRLIADACRFSDQSALLRQLADGLARHGCSRLAALAYTFTWTRARGAGGWKAFGGQTELESLRRATELDRALALRTIADEIERAVSQGGSTIGIAQALVYGFANGGLGVTSTRAFDIWDEAFAVINDRAPRVAAADDPDYTYEPPVPDRGDDLPGDIDVAFARATLATLAHAGREQKRRSFLATEFLIDERPSVVGRAIETALLSLSDPATLTWLLRVIELRDKKASLVLTTCRAALTDLAGRAHLTLRSLARRLLPGAQLPLPPPVDPDPELLERRVVVFHGPVGPAAREPAVAVRDDLVDELAGARLARAEQLLPRLRKAVVKRTATVIAGAPHKERMRRQFRAYADTGGRRRPDVFLATAEAVEDAVQLAAAGARAALFANAQPVADPVELEQALAHALLNDPALPLAVEHTRHPRPDIPPPPLRDDPLWRQLLVAGADESTTRIAVDTSSHTGDGVCGTVATSGHEVVPLVAGGQYDSWRLVAAVERRVLPPRNLSSDVGEFAVRQRVIELRAGDIPQTLTVPPTVTGDLRAWCTSSAPAASVNVPWIPQVIGCDIAIHSGRDGHHALGIQGHLLTPTQWLIAALTLRPNGAVCLADDDGPCLALITWRTEYENSDYYLPWPRLCGSGLVLRNDAFDRLVHVAQGLLIFRDFLIGSPGLGH